MAAAIRSTGQIPLPSIRNTCSSTRHCWPSMSMNGCYGGSTATDKSAVGVCETRTLASVSESEHAVPQLKLAVAALEAQPPESTSGIIRLQVRKESKHHLIICDLHLFDWLLFYPHYLLPDSMRRVFNFMF